MRFAAFFAFVVLSILLKLSTTVRADDPTSEARDAFRKGADLAKDEQWNGALVAFERSAALVPHPYTTFNIGVCERALGHYIRARAAFASVNGSADLPELARAQAEAMLKEAKGLIATFDVTVDPADATLVVDGAAKTLGAAHASIELDPGHHVFTLQRDGYADAVIARDVRPSEHATLAL
ncbi:hypothetical protein BH09MYX1_BH09MYX1_47130 [soil metagenome]